MRSSEGVDSWVTALPRFHTAATPLPPSPGKTWDESLFVTSRPKLSVEDALPARTNFPHASNSTGHPETSQRLESLGKARRISLSGKKADQPSRRSSWLGRWLESRDDTTTHRRSGRFSIPSVFLAPQSHSKLFKKEFKRRQESQPFTTQYEKRSLNHQEAFHQPNPDLRMNRSAQVNGERRQNSTNLPYPSASQQVGEQNSMESQAKSDTPSDRHKAAYDLRGVDADTSAQTIFETHITSNEPNATSVSNDMEQGVDAKRLSKPEMSSRMLSPNDQRQPSAWGSSNTRPCPDEHYNPSKSPSMPFFPWSQGDTQVDEPSLHFTSSPSASAWVHESNASQNMYVPTSSSSSYPWFSSVPSSIPAIFTATRSSPPTTLDRNEQHPVHNVQPDITESHSSQQHLAKDTQHSCSQYDQSYEATSKSLPQDTNSKRTSVIETSPALNSGVPLLRNARHWSMPSELAGALFSAKTSSPVPAPAIGAVDGRAASPFLPARLSVGRNPVTSRAVSTAVASKPHRWSSAPVPLPIPSWIGSRRDSRQLPPARTPPVEELPPIPIVNAGNHFGTYAESQLGKTSSLKPGSIPNTATASSTMPNLFLAASKSTSRRKNANEVFGLAV
ncbi:hypothetical protein MYAM1_001498 [Malassezia yamatoensis]|uniref:Uncharacterized protein n=1 Tax=Malassezia yamatoensis TaxID=253288 RepID=A0AAJ5YU20_9BASI|nr:hypothetical protein MYAM1_001498 [Malassezia yamatoensis]